MSRTSSAKRHDQRRRADSQAHQLARTEERIRRGGRSEPLSRLERERRAQEQFARAMMRREGER